MRFSPQRLTTAHNSAAVRGWTRASAGPPNLRNVIGANGSLGLDEFGELFATVS